MGGMTQEATGGSWSLRSESGRPGVSSPPGNDKGQGGR